MRLFLAIDIPDEVKTSLDMQLAPLRSEYPDMRWVEPQNYHITLFYFGDRYKQETIIKHTENVTFETDRFHMYSGENGILMKTALTFYAGFQKCHPLQNLVKRIKDEMQIVDDLKFFPHLTVARYRIPSKQQYLLLKKKWLKGTVDLEFEVSQITLFESVIEKNAPVYIPQATFPLLTNKEG